MPIGDNIEKIQQVITEALMDEFEAQGHCMTGALINDIEYKVIHETNRVIIEGYMYPYGNILAAGVKPDKIPFSGTARRGHGTGGVSLYIRALQKYAQARIGITDEKKALGVAFAIAKTHKKEGMPTRGSYKYSSTGERTKFVDEAFNKNEDKLGAVIRELAYNLLDVQLDTMISNMQYQLNA